MSEQKMIVIYKPGALTRKGIKDLDECGFKCVQVNGSFSDIQFRMAGGVGFENEIGDMQLLILKAALDSYDFESKLGKLVTNALKAKINQKTDNVRPLGKGERLAAGSSSSQAS